MIVRPATALTRLALRRVGDISAGGLRAYSDDRHVPGERLELELLFSDRASITTLVEVVWVESLGDGAEARFDVGVRFVDASRRDLDRIAALVREP